MEIAKVSIVIPVYCENRTVREIIVVDDGSRNDTRETLNEMQRENQTLKIFFHQKNLGNGPYFISQSC